jgi:hypothetical protein
MARLYANENYPLPAVVELRKRGHDVLTTLDAGMSDQQLSDAEVLNFARAQQRAVITLNRKHFIRLHAQDSDHWGIIACTYDPDFARQAQRVHDAINSISLHRQLVRVNRPDK